MPRPITTIVLLAGLAACDRAAPPPWYAAGTWIDLTYAFDSTTIYWPTATPFHRTVVSAGRTPAGFYYAANDFAAAEHGGTHLDAPIHFSEGRLTADRIPVERLVGPAVVVDVAARAAADPDTRVTRDDLDGWERAHGPIPDGAIVLFRTGWGARWPNRARYLGTTRTGAAAVPELHFPGLDSAAARWLVTARRVHAVGIDTPSIDYGQSTTFDAHQILFASDVPAFENVARLERLPETGAVVIALPMKIRDGSGGPLRIVAWLP
jgi:kynurenine formamidase